jgi:hypothetical protein
MPKADPLLLEVASLFRQLACDPSVTWGYGSYIKPDSGLTHFEEELEQVYEEAQVELNDVIYVCKTGKMTKGWTELSPPQYCQEGITRDGVHIGIGMSFNAEEGWIELITVFIIK